MDMCVGEYYIVAGDRISAEELTEIISEGKIKILVAEKIREEEQTQPTVCGCVAVKPFTNPEEAEIGMLSVSPQLQSNGLGTLLLNGALDLCRSSFKAKKAVVTVIHVRTELLAWYSKVGFKDVNEKMEFPYESQKPVNKDQDLHFKILKIDL
eukprot:TRINITY_DN3312_c0_g1_i2.p1 TRINITY_DN3312_c0_g1~~TRINITY_DN3312_c0_g1_i2.p1  ORF type:complete len:153 (+),score=34.87 TRINITY_DN3312_c0_g1_i2:134-592(+)